MPKYLSLPEEIKKRVSLKNIKLNIGHDLMGMYCDIVLDKKNVGYFNDDGWGGEPDISLLNEDKIKLIQLLENHDWRNRMFTEGGWNFYDSADKINDDSMLSTLIEHLVDIKQKEKVMKQIAKQSEKEILYGTWDNYTRRKFKNGLDLKNLVKAYGIEKFQQFIDNQVKPELKEGQEILNTNFEELGLKK